MTNLKSKISFYYYNESECVYEDNTSLQICASKDRNKHVSWLNIVGIEDGQTMQQAVELFKIHPLVVEDILNPNQRAKVEDYGDLLYIVLRMFVIRDGEVKDQQISIVLRDNVLVTFRETDFGVFKTLIGDKLVSGTSILRKKGEDYLLYTILDTIIDHYFFVVEWVEEQVEKLEFAIFKRPHDSQLAIMQQLKSDILYMRKNMVPVRDLITNLIRNEVEYFETDNKYYLRDLQDHMTRDIEELDFLGDQLTSLMDSYYSLQNQKMNSVIKILTIISTVFMPLTFIVGVYGMNFKYMPELETRCGYFVVLAAMLLLVAIMLFYFKRLGWFDVRELRSGKNKIS